VDLAPGTRVDRYVLSEPLGEGGQGAVWKARDPLDPDHPCALKLVPVAAARPSDVERARREARALARLEHPSLVRCHALFEDLKLGVLGIAMELVAGTSLRALLSDARFGKREREITLEHVAHALAYLHDAGVVHRDVKLDNVLVDNAFFRDPTAPEHVKLVDLGIARVPGPGPELTALGTVVGTLSYLAPELLDPATFDGASAGPTVDVFAFGVMGWLLLSGTHPTGLPAQSSLVDYTRAYRRALEAPERWPEAKPEGQWGDLLADALKLTPRERIPDAQALLGRIEPTATRKPARSKPALPEAPTSVASPRAMRADTALGEGSAAPVGSASAAAARTVDVTPGRTDNAPTTARRGSGWFVVAVTLLGAAAVGVILSQGGFPKLFGTAPSSTPATPLSAPLIPSAEPELDAGPGEAEDAAGDGDTTAIAMNGDPCDAGCPSGRTCGDAGCDEDIDVEDDFTLRFGALLDAEGHSLFATYRTAEVCVSVVGSSNPPICTPIAAAEDGGVPTSGLYVTRQDLVDKGLDVAVEQFVPGSGRASLTTRSGVQFRDGVKHEALCKGLVIDDFPNFPGRAIFYLDEPGDAAVPPRCPRE
jgi:eukaryotic-like serine/threonine-protein kinase